jgi:hypothetical protein
MANDNENAMSPLVNFIARVKWLAECKSFPPIYSIRMNKQSSSMNELQYYQVIIKLVYYVRWKRLHKIITSSRVPFWCLDFVEFKYIFRHQLTSNIIFRTYFHQLCLSISERSNNFESSQTYRQLWTTLDYAPQ